MIRFVLAIGMALWTFTAFPQSDPSPLPKFIGTASMAADGSVTINLGMTGDGKYVDGTFTYKINDLDYEKILKHIGGLKPGETKPVTPWRDE